MPPLSEQKLALVVIFRGNWSSGGFCIMMEGNTSESLTCVTLTLIFVLPNEPRSD
jgi:hypothetical protein